MKIKTCIVAAIVAVSVLIFTGCKKDTAEDNTKDYTALFNNTVWAGEFKYTSRPIQPVSIFFQDGGQFTWYELAGEFAGTWKIENKNITISFPSGSGFKAGISNDNKLTNFQNFAVNGWNMINAELNATAYESLDNTRWQTQNLIINFKAGDKVNMTLGSSIYATSYSDIVYLRKAKSIRFTYPEYKFFMVITNTSTMKGVNEPTGDPEIYPFQIIKQ